ncbi:epoxyqueuosine reductase [Ferrimicrobium acidiphilum]|uniref:epoxyqueuosine reductase n=1 Tax=Ferrimicrobium acidiphilum TaxID=121039 RepID=UPI0023F33690|nr:4Fe-4S double cluster binding domain-containing protein [Ferrimicrobium acidiphilum]
MSELERKFERLLIDKGVVAAGSGAVVPLHFDAQQSRLRIAAGFVDPTHFTYRNPERAAVVARAFPWSHGYVSVAVSYATTLDAETQVAGYAYNRSYEDLREVLAVAVAYLRESGLRAASLFDSNQAFDKGLARRAGIGLVGRHTMVMVPKAGSRVVLGSIFTERLLSVSVGRRFRSDPCRNCRRCVDACPTGAIRLPGTLVAEHCIASILQQDSWSPVDRQLVGARVYGCDSCIDSCPIGWPSREESAPAPLVRWLTAGDQELLEEVGHWYIPRRDPFYVRRNVANALGNRGSLTRDERRALALLCVRSQTRERIEGLRSLLRVRWGR